MPPVAIFNHLAEIERPNPKGFVGAVCPPRTWQARDQKVESNKLKKGKAGGNRSEPAGLESLEGVGEGYGQAGDSEKGDQRYH